MAFPFQPAHLGTNWQYEIEWYPGGDVSSQTNAVIVESKPRNLGTFGIIKINVWTNVDAKGNGVTITPKTPVIVYVQVNTTAMLELRRANV